MMTPHRNNFIDAVYNAAVWTLNLVEKTGSLFIDAVVNSMEAIDNFIDDIKDQITNR